ncbi:MAG: hypothetical protein WCD31_05295 [Gillisia sp.]
MRTNPYYDGIKAKDFVNTVNLPLETLKNNDLIIITRDEEVYFTTKGKIAMSVGFQHYLRLTSEEKELVAPGFTSLQAEKRDLSMIFGGMIISLLFIVAFCAFSFQHL